MASLFDFLSNIRISILLFWLSSLNQRDSREMTNIHNGIGSEGLNEIKVLGGCKANDLVAGEMGKLNSEHPNRS